jgi:hypothetical protein
MRRFSVGALDRSLRFPPHAWKFAPKILGPQPLLLRRGYPGSAAHDFAGDDDPAIGGSERADRPVDLRTGHVGLAGGASEPDRPGLGVHLAAAYELPPHKELSDGWRDPASARTASRVVQALRLPDRVELEIPAR